MNEQKLIQAAESGDVNAAMTLAEHYAKKARRAGDDKVGDVISVEDFFVNLNAESENNPDLEAKAYKYYRIAAEGGVAEAMTEVARRIYDGIGTERNWQGEEYKIWYRRGAEAGDPDAMRVVAYISEDPAEKFKYYKLSAELLPPSLNKQDSIKQTAINYAAGRGTEKNLAAAQEWFAKLSENDVNDAKIELAQITGENFWLEEAAQTSAQAMIQLAEQFVLKNDFPNAFIWYERASEAGDYEATSIVGDFYYIGEGIPQNYAKALEYYERAAENYNMAAVKAALMHYHGRGCPKNPQKAFNMFRKILHTRENFFGVNRFNSVAKFYTGKIYESGEVRPKNSVKAIKWYKRAAGLERMNEYESPHSVPEAMYMVADNYFMRREFSKAAEIYEKLAEYRGRADYPYNLEAAKKLMWIYELGEGVPQDKAKADEWREKISD